MAYDPNFKKPYNPNGFQKKPGFFKKPQPEIDPDKVKLYKAYVGTGNREAPEEILSQMKRIAFELEGFGFILRTGGFDGPEEAFEKSVKELELHLPWREFNNKQSKLTFNSKEALILAKMFHTNFDTLKPAIQAFLAKNVRLLMGNNLKSPAMFMICWSQDGAETSREKTARTGNVGHAIAIASAMKMPVFNLAKPDAESRLKQYLGLPVVETVKTETLMEF